MAKPTKSRAALVSTRDLPKLVESAVKTASQQLGGLADAGPLLSKWGLIGRTVKDAATGQPFADAVSRALVLRGVAAQPAVLTINKLTIAGFIERAAVPTTREL
jgi:hypothetical protein